MTKRAQWVALSLVLCTSFGTTAAHAATRSLDDYRTFRALSIDLKGRIPTRDELAQFESSAFSMNAFLDEALRSPAYSERVRRIYVDRLKLDLGGNSLINGETSKLRRAVVNGPDGKPLAVFFRMGQRRPARSGTNAPTDRGFCMTPDETGITITAAGAVTGTPKNVSQATLDAYTTLVKPWWLYKDYRAANPKDLTNTDALWQAKVPGVAPAANLLAAPPAADAGASTPRVPMTAVRVCKEEAQTGEVGTTMVAFGGPVGLPKGSRIACTSPIAVSGTYDCGCGIGLERCLPHDATTLDGNAFTAPSLLTLGEGTDLDRPNQNRAQWIRRAISLEVAQMFDRILSGDRDFREVVTGKGTRINGTLAQFYRAVGPSSQSTSSLAFGQADPVGLFDVSNVPASLAPSDVDTWVDVADRGPLASGVLTTPAFLSRYGSRRSRAHAVYQTFLCREFVAPPGALLPSDEVDLTKRQGCSSCHTTLEPMAAYFTRVAESDWSFLPASKFPIREPACKQGITGGTVNQCAPFYDPAFATPTAGFLRGAQASVENAEAGPRALGESVSRAPEFASCVVDNVVRSFFGRDTDEHDAKSLAAFEKTFVSSGYKMRALVRAIVTSDAYRASNVFDVREGKD
ncbi:MAG: DUF1585 domain-containing protein [Polyangiaceae bacterium]